MFLATVNKSKQLLHFRFIGQVLAEELTRGKADAVALLEELSPGFRLLSDMDRLDSISADCAPIIGELMELCEQKGIGLVVRVIPEQRKDIGLNILSLFHYRQRPRIVTCKTMVEAAKALSL
jgi:hypothetical protein